MNTLLKLNRPVVVALVRNGEWEGEMVITGGEAQAAGGVLQAIVAKAAELGLKATRAEANCLGYD